MNDLYHHGILGQKWGIRRFQNEDGSLTDAGRKRYNVNIEDARNKLKNAKEQYKSDSKARKNLLRARGRKYAAKKALKDEKIKDRLNNEKKKSKHRLKLEQHYRDRGMSEEEAAIVAYKRVRTEKIIGATAGLTVASAAAIVARKLYKKNVDGFLKEGTTLSRIATSDDKSVHDAFYAYLKKGDNSKYVGIYGSKLQKSGNDVFQKKIKVNKGIKVASERSALNALKQLSGSDSSFNDDLKSELNKSLSEMYIFNSSEKQRQTIKKGIESLNQGKTDQNVLNALNLHLASKSDTAKKFYNQLSKSGYGAIEDINDKKLSEFDTKKPLIVFNSDVSVSSVRKLSENEMSAEHAKVVAKMALKNIIKSVAPKVGVGIAYIASLKGLSNLIDTKKHDKIVAEYRKEHPESKLSYNEILTNYYQ